LMWSTHLLKAPCNGPDIEFLPGAPNGTKKVEPERMLEGGIFKPGKI